MTELSMPARTHVAARIATTALFLATGLGVGAWAACIPVIKLALGLSDAALAAALFAFATGSLLAMLPAGWLATRRGADRVMVGAGLVFGVAVLLPGLAPSLAALIAAALVLGVGNGLLDVSMNAYATAVQRRHGTAIMSSFHAAFSIGGLLGSAAVGALLAHGVGVTTGLAATSVAIIALVLLAAALAGADADASPGDDEPPHGFAWPTRTVLGIGILCFMSMLIEGALADWSGVYLATVTGASVAAAAAGYAGFSIMMSAGRLQGDRTVRRYGAEAVLRYGALIAAAGIGLALSVAEPRLAVVGFALVGLGVANVVPLLFSAAGRLANVAPGVGIAMAATVGYAGFLLGPPVIGLIADRVGLRLALVLLLAAALSIAVFAPRIMRRQAA